MFSKLLLLHIPKVYLSLEQHQLWASAVSEASQVDPQTGREAEGHGQVLKDQACQWCPHSHPVPLAGGSSLGPNPWRFGDTGTCSKSITK
jgi:hypothetical protein